MGSVNCRLLLTEARYGGGTGLFPNRMVNDTESQREAQALLQNTTLYREFLAEREEILRHKWLESEKAGRDVGFDSALMDWITHHRAGWRNARQNRDVVAS